MADINGFVSLDDSNIITVASDPSAAAGTSSPNGTTAIRTDTGELYIKKPGADTNWDKFLTAANSGIGTGTFLRIPIYNTISTGNTLADTVAQNSQNINLSVIAQGTRTTAINYIIPNPGDAVTSANFVLTEGAQTINGTKTFGNDVIVNGNFTVNGTTTIVNSTQTTISDPLITLNKGGVASSGGGVGIEIEENAIITGYLKTAATRNGFDFKAPSIASAFTMSLASLTATRIISVPDSAGTFLVRPTATPGVAGQVSFFQDANNIISDSVLFWDNTNKRLGIGNASPTSVLDVTGTVRLRTLTTAGFVKTDASGNLTSTATVNLATETTGVLPIARGGTNLSATPANGQLLIGNGTGYTLATLTGTTNQVTVTNGAGSITLALPQNIHTGASPTFVGATLTGLSTAGFVKNSAGGVLSTAATVSLTTEVSGILPVANGGTNSSAALSSNRIMVSVGGAIVEAAALTNGQLLIGSTGGAPVASALTGTTNQVIVTNGAGSITLSLPQSINTAATPTFASVNLSNITTGSVLFAGAAGLVSQDNANFFFDNTNNRLGIGTNAPTRALDVNASAIIRGAFKVQTGVKTNWEMDQATVSTTNNTVTTLSTIAVPTDSVLTITATVIARRTGGTAGAVNDNAQYIRTATFKNNAGVVTVAGLQTDYTREDQVGWNATLVVSGTNAVIEVRGATNNNIDWITTYQYSIL